MDAQKPLRKDGVVVKKLGEECLLYDTQAEAVHVVNLVGEFVWGLCDGTHSPDDMAQAVRRDHDVPDGTDVRADIDAILDDFAKLGLLAVGGEQTTA